MKDKTTSFLIDKKGSVTIEFFFMVMLLALMFAFMVDLTVIRSTLGKVDHASYGMVNILRERRALYPNNLESFTSADQGAYRKLAAFLLYGDQSKVNNVEVVLEKWDGVNQYQVFGESNDCKPYESLKQLTVLSPYSEPTGNQKASRKVPLYQVTICVKTFSLFKSMLVDDPAKIGGAIRSSTMSVAR